MKHLGDRKNKQFINTIKNNLNSVNITNKHKMARRQKYKNLRFQGKIMKILQILCNDDILLFCTLKFTETRHINGAKISLDKQELQFCQRDRIRDFK